MEEKKTVELTHSRAVIIEFEEDPENDNVDYRLSYYGDIPIHKAIAAMEMAKSKIIFDEFQKEAKR